MQRSVYYQLFPAFSFLAFRGSLLLPSQQEPLILFPMKRCLMEVKFLVGQESPLRVPGTRLGGRVHIGSLTRGCQDQNGEIQFLGVGGTMVLMVVFTCCLG